MLFDYLNTVTNVAWIIATVLLMAIGVFLTVRFRYIQFTKIKYALGYLRSSIPTKEERKTGKRRGKGEINSFKALSMALAATIGVGNIVGVATAIHLGGPGAVFWIWFMAVIGMAFKYSEALLAVRFRENNVNGEFVGGPMYYIKNGLPKKWHWLGFLYALFGIVAMFGIGNLVQANAVSTALHNELGVDIYFIAIVLAVLVGVVLIGGVKRIGHVASQLVPLMALFYISGGIAVLVFNFSSIPAAFSLIVTSAFTGTAAAGGFVGAVMIEAIRYGVARGVFANEAGMGTAAIAHAVARNNPVRQGVIAMLGTFIDTFMVCTMTALVIIVTGAWMSGETGPVLSALAFTNTLGSYGAWVVTICITIFAFSTTIAYSYYGERCAEFLVGSKIVKPYRLFWVVGVFIGAVMQLELVWLIADLLNAFMIVPNIIALLLLSPVVVRLTKEYFTAPV